MMRAALPLGLTLLVLVWAMSAAAQTLTLSGYSGDPDYGYIPAKPITLGGFEGDEEARREALSKLLLSREGERMAWRFIDRCCPFHDSRDLTWETATDLYVVEAPGERPRRLFVNFFVEEPALIPIGLTGHRNAEERRAFDAANALQGPARLRALAETAKQGAILARRTLIQEDGAARAAGVDVRNLLIKGMAEYEPAAFMTVGVYGFSDNGPPGKNSVPVEMFRYAARYGSPEARELLGAILLSDHDGPPEPGEALMWLRLAAEDGAQNAQYRYGAAKFYGRYGLEKNVSLGGLFLSIAAERGSEQAQAALAALEALAEEREDGWERLEAFKASTARLRDAWRNALVPNEPTYRTEIAARDGDPAAMSEYARRLFNGVTTRADNVEAYFFARLAEAHGHDGLYPATRYAELGGLSDEQRAEVEARVQAWAPTFYR